MTAYRSSSVASAAGVAAITPALPAGTIVGDVLAAFVFAKETTNPPAASYVVNDLAGWAGLTAQAFFPPGMRVRPFTKPVVAGEAAPTFTTDAVVDFLACVLVALSDAGATPRASARATDSLTPFVVPAMVMPAASVILLAALGFTRGSTTTTPPAGYTMPQNGDIGGVNGMEWAVSYRAYVGADPPAASYLVSNGGTALLYHVAIGQPAPVARGFPRRFW